MVSSFKQCISKYLKVTIEVIIRVLIQIQQISIEPSNDKNNQKCVPLENRYSPVHKSPYLPYNVFLFIKKNPMFHLTPCHKPPSINQLKMYLSTSMTLQRTFIHVFLISICIDPNMLRFFFLLHALELQAASTT